ncbi:prephenate dehydratase [Methanocaldococcus infernus]
MKLYTLPKGTYTETAGKKILKYLNAKLCYCQNIYEIFEKAKDGYGIVPIENSIEGSVNLTQDLLLEYDYKIVGETVLDIHHNLIGHSKEKIKIIYSHPQALAQCRKYIKKHGWEVKAVESTAKAVELASKNEEVGAIGSEGLAKLHGLKILERNIEDYKNNKTRFIVIGKKEIDGNFNKYKTSIVFELKEDKPGALYHILKEFALREINLTRIESRPSKRMLGTYIFYIDYEGLNLEVLESLKRYVSFLRVLGSYPILV